MLGMLHTEEGTTALLRRTRRAREREPDRKASDKPLPMAAQPQHVRLVVARAHRGPVSARAPMRMPMPTRASSGMRIGH